MEITNNYKKQFLKIAKDILENFEQMLTFVQDFLKYL